MATTAFEDFSATPETQAPDLLVAQTDPAGQAALAEPTGPAPATTTIEVADDLTLTLPEGASIELPRVNGTDLEFVQPDGTVIVVPNGALIGLAIVIGDTTIPADTVAALFDANNIETAAGPAAAAAPPSSGGNFARPVPGIGDGLPLIDLLGYDDYELGTPELEDLEDGPGFRRAAANNRPTIDIDPREGDSGNGNAGPGSALVNEAGLSIGSDDTANSEFATGSFTLGDPDGLATLVSLTVGTDTVSMSFLVGATFSGLYGTLTITAYNAATGVVDYRYELTDPYTTDPAAANGTNIELGRDIFIVTVSDGVSDSLPAAITIDIVDDVPSVSGFAPDGKLPVILDDDDVTDYAAGNPGGDGDDGDGITTTGSMQFSAGADGLKSIVVSPIVGLTAIHVDSVTGIGTPYLVDQVWVASGQGGTLTGKITVGAMTYDAFLLTVDAAGAYTFTAKLPMSHPLQNNPDTQATELAWEDNLALAFGFLVTDGDGDTGTGTLTINIDDDTPEFTTREGVENVDVVAFGVPVIGDLNIAFGEDGQFADKGLVISGWPQIVGFTTTLSDDGLKLTAKLATGDTLYTLTLNNDGTYSFVFNDSVLASGALQPVNVSGGFAPTASVDFDGFTLVGLSDDLNGSGAGIGIADADMNNNDKFRIDFDLPMESVDIGVNSLGGGTTRLDWVARDANGDIVDQGSTAAFGSDGIITITPGGAFDSLEVTTVTVTGNDNNAKWKLVSVGGDVAGGIDFDFDSLDFSVTGKDGDGDAISDSFTVGFAIAPETNATSASGNEDAAPIAVALSGSDLDGTVVSFVIGTLPLPANGTLYRDAAGLIPLASGDVVTATAEAATVYFKPAADYHGSASFTYASTDDDGQTDATPATATITIADVNDLPEVTNSTVWLPSDPAQQAPGYGLGYPLAVSIPTDVDGDNVIVTATNAPSGLWYFNGTNYAQVTAGMELYNPANGINLLDNLVYRPTATVDDTPTNTLNLSATDGASTVAYSVTIHEVAPTSVPGPSGQFGDGNDPLNSGNGINQLLTLGAAFANAIVSDPHSGSITLKTDFQGRNGYSVPIQVADRNGDTLEAQVDVFLIVNGATFILVDNGDSNPNTWAFNGTLMETTIDFDNAVNLNNSSQTLAQYLTANPPAAGNQWTIQYVDNVQGNDQARLVEFDLNFFNPGNPAITVTGDANVANQIYGGSGSDTLTGGDLDDVIMGRGGNDTIDGGGGIDYLDFSDATTGIDFTLVQSGSDTTVNLAAYGLGTDTYRNIEGVIGSGHNDTLTGTSSADYLVGGSGSDTLIGGFGADQLTGGAGIDTFVIGADAITSAVDDFIADYNHVDGDIIDLSDLLATLGNNAPADAGEAEQYVNLQQNANGTTSIMIDADGKGAGGVMTEVATLNGLHNVIRVLFDDTDTTTDIT